MLDWDEEWKIPPTKLDPLAQPKLKISDVNEEEEEDDEDRGKGPEDLMPQPTPRNDRKRKEFETGRTRQ